jgi:hypothetical protein
VFDDVRSKVQKLNKVYRRHTESIQTNPIIKHYLEELHENYVVVPIDKAKNNIAIVCKKFYIEKSMQELKSFKDSINVKNDDNTYVQIDKDKTSIINEHKKYLKSKLNINEIPDKFPFLYWIPKMHKKPFSKQRYIAASSKCTTKPLSAILTKCFKLIEKQHRFICSRYETSYGINPMWIIQNSSDVHKNIATFNRKKNCRNIRTYDFSTLYTSIPHKKLKTRLSQVIKKAFSTSNKSFISIYDSYARWTNSPH